MKIALFDTIAHPTPILREWGIGFLDLGHEVDYYPTQQYSIGHSTGTYYDLIVYAGNMSIREFENIKQSHPTTKIVCCTDSLQSHHSQYKGLVDFYITTQHECSTLVQSYNDIGFKLYNVPLAGNDHLFYPVDRVKQYDVCFIGTLAHGDRGENQYLYPFFNELKYKTYLAGMTYLHYGIPNLPYEHANEIRNRTKVNINFHYGYQKYGEGTPADRVDLNQSVYNIALSKGFQVCDHALVTSLFKNSIVVSDTASWVDTVDYYIHNDQAREALAEESYRIAMQDHTWKVRMSQFLTLLNDHTNYA